MRSDREAAGRWLDELAQLELDAETDPGTLTRAAWALHHTYTSIEAILERTIRIVEGDLPEGPDYHRELLDTAALAIESVRPALLRRETVVALHDLRGFRHFVRHAYAVELDPERLADLQRRTATLRPELDADLDRLEAWLGDLAEAFDED